jgi:membrane-bound lytic murein transglycosylase D
MVALAAAPADAETFEKPTRLRGAVAFWKRVYGEWSVDDIALHDEKNLGVVYRVVHVPARGEKDGQGRTRNDAINEARKELIVVLRKFAASPPSSNDGMTALEKEVFDNLQGISEPYARIEGIHAQNGLKERFTQGYINSGLYADFISSTLQNAGLPQELIGIAFVESLFYVGARSKVGAAGVWQFMPATGREYMNVNNVVDERWDPILATEAAAKYLKQAKRDLGTWPLAVTSYNYGRGGAKGLTQEVGTTDFDTILEKGVGKRFGFAARNYYACFLAVNEILSEAKTRFAGIARLQPWDYDVVRLPAPLFAEQIVAAADVPLAAFDFLNPALTMEALYSKVPLPHGMSVRLPRGRGDNSVVAMRLLPSTEKDKVAYAVQAMHKANGKQTLAAVARQYGIAADVLAARTGLVATDMLAKNTVVPIPATSVRTSLLPEARAMSVPPMTALPAPVLTAENVRLPTGAPSVRPGRRLSSTAVAAMTGARGEVTMQLTFTDVMLPDTDVLTGAVQPSALPDIDVMAGAISTPAARDVTQEETEPRS